MYKKLSKQFIKFCLVGLLSTIVGILTFVIFLDFLGAHYLISSIMSFVFGIAVSYPLNKSWTFSSSKKDKKKILQYFLVYIFSLAINLIFLKISVENFAIDAKIAYILSIGITTCTNFIGTRFFVFK